MSMKLLSKAVRDLSFAALALCAAGAAPASAKTFVYVSNAQDGNIDAYVLDKSNGALTSIGKTDAGKLVMPMAVSPNKKFLYAAIRSDPFRVATYAINSETGALTQKATAPLPDSMPYVSVDATGRFLFTASYGGDKIAVSPIGESGVVEAAAIQIIPTGRNAHAILADRTNKFVYVPNLGANHILQFLFDAKTGKLTPNEPAAVSARPGDGPRHLVFAPDNKHLYVLNELTGNVAQFAIDQNKGTLSEVDSIGSVPADAGLVPGVAQAPAGTTPAPAAAAPKADEKPKVWAADIQLTPNGKFLYSTERTLSKIALFSVAPGTGKLTYVTNFATEKQPRGIKIDPSGAFLVASGEKSDRLAVYKIDQGDGRLTELNRYPVGNGANWVEIVETPYTSAVRSGPACDEAKHSARRRCRDAAKFCLG
jgi:6-phosphogluconolactonase